MRGRQILIAAVDRIVQFNILEFYRGQHTYVGIDTLGLSSVATGAVLRELGPGFASGHLKPFPIKSSAIYPLEQAKAAFVAVAGSSRDRVILRPAASHSRSQVFLRYCTETNLSACRERQRLFLIERHVRASFSLRQVVDGPCFRRIAARICILFDTAAASPCEQTEKPVLDSGNIVVLSGLLIGLVYGAVGLLSGFCLLSSLRGWWAEGDGRLVRTYALAIGVAVAATQLLAAAGLVDLGKSIYLQPSFSAPVMFFGGLLFGYGMVLSNGCGSRALVLLGRGNLRSFVVVIVLASSPR